MLSKADAETIRRLSEAAANRDYAIYVALTENGATVAEIVALTGLSRARVYQIKKEQAVAS